MNAYRAVVFIKNVQTDELCQYVGYGNQPSGNVKLLGRNTEHCMVGEGDMRKVNTTHDSGPPPLAPSTSQAPLEAEVANELPSATGRLYKFCAVGVTSPEMKEETHI